MAHNQGFVPGKVWSLKHVTSPKFHLSGPPRDIVGINDNSWIDNPYQLKRIKELEARDCKKFFGSKNFKIPEGELLPEPVSMPNNQRAHWYEKKGYEAQLVHDNGQAYWYYLMAAQKARTFYDKRRYARAWDSNLKTWQAIQGRFL